jgi:hypothetical protein
MGRFEFNTDPDSPLLLNLDPNRIQIIIPYVMKLPGIWIRIKIKGWIRTCVN